MNLIAFLLKLPWYAYFAIAGGVVWLGMQTAGGAEQRAAEIRAALEAGPPAAVALDAYRRPDQKFAEGTLRAQVVVDETTRLVDRKNGVKTGEDVMVVLADPTAPADTKVFPALMIFTTSEYAHFTEWAANHIVDYGPLGPIIEFSAEISTADGEASHAKKALADRGGSVTKDVIYPTPYFTSREEYLARRLDSAEDTQGTMNGTAAFIALFGLGKLLIGRRVRSIRQAKVNQGLAAQAQADAFNMQNQQGLRNI